MDMIATATKFLKEAQGRDVDINKVIEAGQQPFIIGTVHPVRIICNGIIKHTF